MPPTFRSRFKNDKLFNFRNELKPKVEMKNAFAENLHNLEIACELLKHKIEYTGSQSKRNLSDSFNILLTFLSTDFLFLADSIEMSLSNLNKLISVRFFVVFCNRDLSTFYGNDPANHQKKFLATSSRLNTLKINISVDFISSINGFIGMN